jgi:hypothetical protein
MTKNVREGTEWNKRKELKWTHEMPLSFPSNLTNNLNARRLDVGLTDFSGEGAPRALQLLLIRCGTWGCGRESENYSKSKMLRMVARAANLVWIARGIGVSEKRRFFSSVHSWCGLSSLRPIHEPFFFRLCSPRGFVQMLVNLIELKCFTMSARRKRLTRMTVCS